MTFNYETVGNSSYLVASFTNGQGLINYQVQMLTNNEIKNIIKANKRQKNDDIIISYNITSKISLGQIDSRNKITKLGLINIIEGALAALEDIEEYQLVSSGIVFDEEYIYVNPSTYEPSFVYLPCTVDDSGIEPLKQFLLSLIMGSKVEMTNDNFVQVLLETLNNMALTSDDLRKLCTKYKTESGQKESSKPQQLKVEQQPINVAPKTIPGTIPPVNIPQSNPQNIVPQQGQQQPQSIPQVPVAPQKKTIPVVDSQKNKKEKIKAEKENNPKKNIFLILQLVFIGVIVALSLTGVLNNEGGSINFTYLLGILIAVGGVDFVIYREMFVNNKKDNKEEKTPKTPKAGTAPTAIPKKPPMAMPSKEIPIPVGTPKAQPVNNISVQPNYNNAPQYVPQVAPQAVPQPAYVPPQTAEQYNTEVQGFESDDTVVLDDDNTAAHLEFYENGLVTKIKLDKDIVTVGKLSSQCDFAINSNKISKIHAEFIVRGNEYFVKDCNSTNGTYINGSTQRITSNTEYQIYDGYRITLANVDLTLRC